MELCRYCGKEIGSLNGSPLIYVKVGYKVYKRIPNNLDEICHDCGADMGKYHHYGCDMEKCPNCGGQLAFLCDCGQNIKLKKNNIINWFLAHL